MFSSTELTALKSWAIEGMEILKGHLQCKIFTHAEKEDKRREYYVLESAVQEICRWQSEYVSVDAEQLGHMLFICDEYKHYAYELCESGKISAKEFAEVCYMIGQLVVKIELGALTAVDTTELYEWEMTLL